MIQFLHTDTLWPGTKTPWALTAEGKPPADNAHRRFRERRGCRVRPYRPGAGLNWSLTTALRPALAPSRALLGLRYRLLVPREWLSPAIARGARSPCTRGSHLSWISRRRRLKQAGCRRRRRRRHGHEGGPHWRSVLGAGPFREPHPLWRQQRPYWAGA